MYLAACYKYLEKNLPKIFSKEEIHDQIKTILERCSFWIKKIYVKNNPILKTEIGVAL
jgi:hypothetical protein